MAIRIPKRRLSVNWSNESRRKFDFRVPLPRRKISGFFDALVKTRGKRIKVIFMCPGGMESSVLAKNLFRELLAEEGLGNYFELDFEGYMTRSPETIADEIRGSDFVVPLYLDPHGVVGNASKLIEPAKRPVLMSSYFKDEIGEQYNRANYMKILSVIIKKLRSKF